MSLPMIARVVLVIAVLGGVFGTTAPRPQPDISPVAGRLSKGMLAGVALSGAGADQVSRAILMFLLLKTVGYQTKYGLDLWTSSSIASSLRTSRSTVASSAVTHTAAYAMYHEVLRRTGSPLLALLSGATGLMTGHTARFLAHGTEID